MTEERFRLEHRLVPVSLDVWEDRPPHTSWRCLDCDDEWVGLPDDDDDCRGE